VIVDNAQRVRSKGRAIVRLMPDPLARAVRAGIRTARRVLGPNPLPQLGTARGYPTSLEGPMYPPIERPWPAPPLVEEPFRAAVAGESVRPLAYDLALFEALNAEYESKRIVSKAPAYDCESVALRSRSRLEGIHARLGLANQRVLEIGCGAGYEVWYLGNHFGSDAWGLDISERRSWPALTGERVHLLEADIAADHALPRDSFDRAISFTVWEHITRPQAALQQLHHVLKPGGLAWIRANLYRGPTASHLYRHIYFPFPHLLFADDVIAAGLERAGKAPVGAAWVNKLTWEQYEATILALGFRIRALRFDEIPLDLDFYERFEDVLGRYPKIDLERDFFTVILEKPR
jgi:SAM-dependent methyltransferase